MRLIALLNGEKKRSVTTSSDTTKYQHSDASRVTWVTKARFVQVEALNSRRRPSFELRNKCAIINCAAKTKLHADRYSSGAILCSQAIAQITDLAITSDRSQKKKSEIAKASLRVNLRPTHERP